MVKTYEKEMEGPLNDYFRSEVGLDKVNIQSQKAIRLDFGKKRRQPDVYGIKDGGGGKYKVHMVEAKQSPSNAHTAGKQLRELRSYSDYLYGSFLKHEWESIPEYDKRNIKRDFKKAGFGILLVEPSKNKVFKLVRAKRNKKTTEHCRIKVKEAFAPPFPDVNAPKYRNFLSRSYAKYADELLWFSSKLMEELRERLKEIDSKLTRMTIHTGSISTKRSTTLYMRKHIYRRRFEYKICLDTFGTLEEDKTPQLSVGFVMHKNELNRMNTHKEKSFNRFILGERGYPGLSNFTSYLWFMNSQKQLLKRPKRIHGNSSKKALEELFTDPDYGGSPDTDYIGIYQSIDIADRSFEDIIQDVKVVTKAINRVLKRLRKKR